MLEDQKEDGTIAVGQGIPLDIYTYLNLSERKQIEVMLNQHHTLKKIAISQSRDLSGIIHVIFIVVAVSLARNAVRFFLSLSRHPILDNPTQLCDISITSPYC